MATINVRYFRYPSLVALFALMLTSGTFGQLSFHNDPSQNSFSIKLPAFQQSFTRYFGNQPQGSLLQQQQQQQHQQQQQIPSALSHPSLIGSQAQAYQQQHQQQQPLYYQPQAQPQPSQSQTPQQDGLSRYVAQFPDQPHYTVQENYINPNIRLRLQQQRLVQQQQQQQQQQYYAQPANYQGFGAFGSPAQPTPTAQDAAAYAAGNQQPQYEYVQQQPTGPDSQQEQIAQPQLGVRGYQQQQQQQSQQQQAEGDAAAAAKLIGVAFSPSNEVSQVKFSSGGLKYNF